MDREQMFVALSHMRTSVNDSGDARDIFATALADIAEKVSIDEMRRLLLVGAYLFNSIPDEPEQHAHFMIGSTPHRH
jgi:hypothetical protein